MKKIFFVSAIIFLAINCHAQLNNTKWKTTLQLDEAVDVVFNFKNDTLAVTSLEDNSNLETMKYTLHDTTLTIQKLYGQSQCDTATGTYACKINANEMHLMLIADNCNDRAAIIKDIKLNKQE